MKIETFCQGKKYRSEFCKSSFKTFLVFSSVEGEDTLKILTSGWMFTCYTFNPSLQKLRILFSSRPLHYKVCSKNVKLRPSLSFYYKISLHKHPNCKQKNNFSKSYKYPPRHHSIHSQIRQAQVKIVLLLSSQTISRNQRHSV